MGPQILEDLEVAPLKLKWPPKGLRTRCQICGRAISPCARHKGHIDVHHAAIKQQNKQAEVIADLHRRYEMWKNNGNNPDGQVVCRKCLRVFPSKELLDNHVKRQHFLDGVPLVFVSPKTSISSISIDQKEGI